MDGSARTQGLMEWEEIRLGGGLERLRFNGGYDSTVGEAVGGTHFIFDTEVLRIFFLQIY